MNNPQLPIDIIIKILTYLSHMCTICKNHQNIKTYHICEKKIESSSFLELRLLRKKIAEVFQPNYFFFLKKRLAQNIEKLPNHITVLKLHKWEPKHAKHIEKILINNLQIHKMNIIETSCLYYYKDMECKNYFHNLTAYEGPYFLNLYDFINLKKITIHDLVEPQPHFPQ